MNVSGLFGAVTLVVQLQVTDMTVTHQKPLHSWELGVEEPITNHLGWALSFRKEGRLAHEGYWLSLSGVWWQPLYRSLGGWVHGGVEWGFPGHEYSLFESSQDAQGRLVSQRWVHLVQNADVTTVSPFVGLAVSHPVVGPISIRSGVNLRLMPFSVQEARRDESSGLLVSVRDDQGRKVIPAFTVAVTVSF